MPHVMLELSIFLRMTVKSAKRYARAVGPPSAPEKNGVACRPDVIAWEVTTNYLSFQSRAGNARDGERSRSGLSSLPFYTGRVRADLYYMYNYENELSKKDKHSSRA